VKRKSFENLHEMKKKEEGSLLPFAQSICTHYSCFENMGRFVTLKKNQVQNMGCKKQGAKNRVIGSQKEKRPGCLFLFL
jgi:hypothetical protein